VFLKYYNVSHEKNMLSNIGKYYIINNKIDQFNAISNVKIIQNFNEKKLYYSPIVKNEILPSLIIKIDENKKKHLLLKKNKKIRSNLVKIIIFILKTKKKYLELKLIIFQEKLRIMMTFLRLLIKQIFYFHFLINIVLCSKILVISSMKYHRNVKLS
jgi:hypothetical protein